MTTPTQPTRPAGKKNQKLSRGLVALSASAVAVIYLAGFGVTSGADAVLAQSGAASSTPTASTVSVAAAPTATSPSVSVAPSAPSSSTTGGNPYLNNGGGRRGSIGETAPSGASSGSSTSSSSSTSTSTTSPSANAGSGVAVASPSPTASSSSASTSTGTSSAPAASSSTSATTTSSGLKDGTYKGTGTSRRGSISVAVTVAGGKISNVSITGSTTEYPTSRISALPAQVVSRQSAQVDNVSGATYSAQAFKSAVQQALSQATA